jgi:hypothetical protein
MLALGRGDAAGAWHCGFLRKRPADGVISSGRSTSDGRHMKEGIEVAKKSARQRYFFKDDYQVCAIAEAKYGVNGKRMKLRRQCPFNVQVINSKGLLINSILRSEPPLAARLETEAKHQIPIAPRGIPLFLGQKFWRWGTMLKSILSGSN